MLDELRRQKVRARTEFVDADALAAVAGSFPSLEDILIAMEMAKERNAAPPGQDVYKGGVNDAPSRKLRR